EHVFGFIEQSMKGFILRSVGMIRAKSNIFLTCLVYNIDRARKLKFI
ncbi:MAG: IS5/IS1182 family transposase, partial [Succinatimonas sp.]|nr:IS5/IS1182 family transposase [Succinivibrio sp.]MCI7025339.1 IS5/IS1182 family transposase [Succinatimonas sp.]